MRRASKPTRPVCGACVAEAQKVDCRPAVFCTAEGKTAILAGMEAPAALQQCVRCEQPMLARLRLAMTRLAAAERARSWAMVAGWEERAASRQGLGLLLYERR